MKRSIVLGHHAWKVQALGYLCFVPATLFPSTGVATIIAFVCVMLALIGAILCAALHDVQPCAKCAANGPVDGPWEAYESRGVLRAHHRVSDWRVTVTAIVVMIVAMFVAPGWSAWVSCVWMCVLAGGVVLARFHRPFRPWCIRCNPGGGGGHDDIADVPTPTAPQAR